MSAKALALQYFANMLDPSLHHKTVEGLVENVRDLVFSDQTTWEELGFTDGDCIDRLRQAQARNKETDPSHPRELYESLVAGSR